MRISDQDLREFITLAEIDGVKLTTEEARVAAMRLLLLYQHLAQPTPAEKEALLAKRRERATVSEKPRQQL